ncbi:hypothetical protein MU448_07590 [Streptococcus sp. O1]|nr:hypothetical protein [Streptococcus sp. O1]MCQ9214287.1 hypothetical protein [Streptococcus sp. O1]
MIQSERLGKESQLSHLMNRMMLMQWWISSMAIMQLEVENELLLFFKGAGSKAPLE